MEVKSLSFKILSLELQVDIEIIARDTCQENYMNFENSGVTIEITDVMICAGAPEGGKDFCTVRFVKNISELN